MGTFSKIPFAILREPKVRGFIRDLTSIPLTSNLILMKTDGKLSGI